RRCLLHGAQRRPGRVSPLGRGGGHLRADPPELRSPARLRGRGHGGRGGGVQRVRGHTARMQIVTVAHAEGQAVVPSDASHYYRNFEERIPFNTLHDLPGMYRAFDTIRELASSPEMVIPGHDPLVLERLKKVGDGIVELCCRAR